MPRINFDDNVESQDEFWNLLPLAGGDRDAALGKLVRFFRIAQKAYGDAHAICPDELEAKGLRCMIESGWAVPNPTGGYRCKGEVEQFAWYRQKLEAGAKGGRPKKPLEPDGNSENRPVISGNRQEPTTNPLSPAPVPAPVLKSLSLPESFARRLASVTGKAREREIEAFGRIREGFGDEDEIAAVVQAVEARGTDLRGDPLVSLMGYLEIAYAAERDVFREEKARKARADARRERALSEKREAEAELERSAREARERAEAFERAFPTPEAQAQAIERLTRPARWFRDKTSAGARTFAINAWWTNENRSEAEPRAG